MGLDDKGIVVLDNGGYNIKAGYVSAEERSRGCDVQSLSSPPEIFPNAVAKPPKKSSSVATKRNGGFLVSAELYDLPSYSGKHDATAMVLRLENLKERFGEPIQYPPRSFPFGPFHYHWRRTVL